MRLRKSKRRIKYIVIHCSATPEGRSHNATDIDRWHRQFGWSGIGYNYVIKLNGDIEAGRHVDLIPAQVRGFNRNAIGICYIGGVDAVWLKPKDTRTLAQKKSLVVLLKELRKLYPGARILGHRDFRGVRKACPSFNAKKEYENI